MLSRWLIDRLKIAYYVPFSSTSTSEEFLGHNMDSTSKTKEVQVMGGMYLLSRSNQGQFFCAQLKNF